VPRQVAHRVQPSDRDEADRRPPQRREGDGDAHSGPPIETERLGGREEAEGHREDESAACVAEGEAASRDAVPVGQLRHVGEVGVVGQDRGPVGDVGHDEGEHPGQRRAQGHGGERQRRDRTDAGADDEQPALGGRPVGEGTEEREGQDLQDHRQADGVGEQRGGARVQPEQRDAAVLVGGGLGDRGEEGPPTAVTTVVTNAEFATS
jgi:hypothetical protein